jgi:hypothetical protein
MLEAVLGIISEAWDRGRGTAGDNELEEDALISRAEASDDELDCIGETWPLTGDTRPSDNLRGGKLVIPSPQSDNVYLPRSIRKTR